jgi:plasmid maintenance system killer protein
VHFYVDRVESLEYYKNLEQKINKYSAAANQSDVLKPNSKDFDLKKARKHWEDIVVNAANPTEWVPF